VSTNTRPDEERSLYCKLDEEALLLKGVRVTERVDQLKAFHLQKEDLATQIKAVAAKEKATSLALEMLSDEIKHKRELQPVTCRWERGQDQWVCHRVDTGEVVDTSPITMADKQERLFS
jgi:hypothetical protein